MLEGYVHPDFRDLARVLAGQIPRARRPDAPGGAALSVWHRGEVVVDCWGGTRDAEGNPWEEGTMALSFSTTKGVASTLLHILADRGLVDYDAPVREYWPEFAQEGKEHITVRQLLCHEAGLYNIRDMIDDAQRMLDWDHMVEVLAAARPTHEPGKHHGYHGFTFGWLVGELVRRVTGRSFADALAAEIAEPLALDGLYCGVPEAELGRRARLIPPKRRPPSPDIFAGPGRLLSRGLKAARIRYDPAEAAAALMPKGIDTFDFDSEAVAAASIPAANGTFTARSLAKLYAALAGGGRMNGVRLVSPETLSRMRQVQNQGMGRVVPLSMRWRLGYHRVHTIRARVPGGIGHSGYGGSGAWADPERNLAVALVLNSGAGSPFGDLRIIQISTAAIRCADKR